MEACKSKFDFYSTKGYFCWTLFELFFCSKKIEKIEAATIIKDFIDFYLRLNNPRVETLYREAQNQNDWSRFQELNDWTDEQLYCFKKGLQWYLED